MKTLAALLNLILYLKGMDQLSRVFSKIKGDKWSLEYNPPELGTRKLIITNLTTPIRVPMRGHFIIYLILNKNKEFFRAQ
jgi:hypothetical protein